MYHNLYQKYINKSLTQRGGKYGFEFKYKGKPIQRQFSEENQILIERARQSSISGININHIITEGKNAGQVIEFQIGFFGIGPDDNSRPPNIYNDSKYKIIDTGHIEIPIPKVTIRNVYSFTHGEEGLIFDFSNENQYRLNDMFINNREEEILFESYPNRLMFKIKREPLNIRIIRPYLQQTVLSSIPAYSFPSITEINPEVVLTPDTIIYVNNNRLPKVMVRDYIINNGIRTLCLKRPEPDIEKLKCQRCHIWEKSILLTTCRHFALCDSCYITETMTEQSIICPVCNVNNNFSIIQVKQ